METTTQPIPAAKRRFNLSNLLVGRPLETRTLAHQVSVGRQVAPERLLAIIAQMLSALSRAHILDIIHRVINNPVLPHIHRLFFQLFSRL